MQRPHITRLAASTLLTVALAACTTYDPYTRDAQTSKATTGAVIGGITDSTGDDNYNQRLSEQRATAVFQYLRGQGLLEQRIISRGYGEEYPVASNAAAEGRALNRRVELALAPLTENGG